jgi:hypothetical protein
MMWICALTQNHVILPNYPKKCAGQFAKAFHNKMEILRSQADPKNKTSFNIETIPRAIKDTSIKFTTLEIIK